MEVGDLMRKRVRSARSWRFIAFALGVIQLAGIALAQEPQPKYVDPGRPGGPPSDAIVLFDGKDLAEWTRQDGSPAGCTVGDGAMTCKTGAGDIYSKRKFSSAQIHLEFAAPSMPDQKGQARGNSGVYLHGRYEIQILDSYQNPTYPKGACGALYGQAAPLVNASRPPQQWQTYDIIFRAPKCGADGKLIEHGRVTVLHNGVLIQDNVRILDVGRGCLEDRIGEPGPLTLQDHNYRGAPMTVMRFRNIWYRPLEDEPGK